MLSALGQGFSNWVATLKWVLWRSVRVRQNTRSYGWRLV